MLKDEKAAMAAWGLYVLLVGLSPWVSIPYSDSTALVFPIAILYLYTRQKQQKGWKKACLWGAIGLLTMLGYHIKPQVAIATIAICGIELWNGLFRLRACLRNKKHLVWGRRFYGGLLPGSSSGERRNRDASAGD